MTIDAMATTLPSRGRAGRRRRWGVALVLVLATGGVLAGYGFRRYKQHQAAKYVPPVFTEPGPGPRAPTAEWLGGKVGFSRHGAVESTTASWSLACSDRGSRALMKEIRDKKREEVARAEARGEPDTVTGASILARHTARDDNPQIRWSCGGVTSEKLRDRERPTSSGRLLFVFDDDRAPLRHASYQRNHDDWREALRDYADSRGAMSLKFGSATESGTLPIVELSDDVPLTKYARREAMWRFSDVVARVSIVNLGGHGYSVSEIVEVPWPVRADAPAR